MTPQEAADAFPPIPDDVIAEVVALMTLETYR